MTRRQADLYVAASGACPHPTFPKTWNYYCLATAAQPLGGGVCVVDKCPLVKDLEDLRSVRPFPFHHIALLSMDRWWWSLLLEDCSS